MISIDRLALHVAPMSGGEAERLGLAVAEALRRWEPPDKPIDLARVKVELEAERSPGRSPESLAERIAAAVMAAALREAGP